MKKVENAARQMLASFIESTKLSDLIIPTKHDNPAARKLIEITVPVNKYRYFMYTTVLSGGAQTPKKVSDFLIST